MCSFVIRMAITTEIIIKTVCEVLELDRDKLLGYNKSENYVDGRFIAMFLMRKHLSSINRHKNEVVCFYDEISKTFNRKQHGTAINACKKVEYLLKNKKFKVKYDLIIKAL